MSAPHTRQWCGVRHVNGYLGATVASALLFAGYTVRAAPPSVAAAIQARQANYKEIGGDFKAINDELKGGSPDVAAISTSAQDLYSRAAGQLKYFVAGSGPESGVKTRAKAEIWADEATFKKLLGEMVDAAAALSQAAGTRDITAISAQRTKLGATCKACHDKFREPE